MVDFGELILQIRVMKELFGSDDCVMKMDTCYPHQDYEQGIFYDESRLHIISLSVLEKNSELFLQLARNWNISATI